MRQGLTRWALALLALVVIVGAGCKNEPALLIKATADAKVEQYDLYIRDDDAQQIIFHSGFNPVLAPGEKSDDGTGTRDLTKEALKIAVKLSKGGHYTVLLVGVMGQLVDGKPGIGATQLFWAGRYQIQGATSVAARLLSVQPGDDFDGDLFPDVSSFLQHTPEAVTLYSSQLDLLDCDDRVDHPTTSDGKVIPIMAAAINPFAVEVCGDGYDEDCNGNIDEPCIDADKDGDPKGDDCDDKDPTRHHANAKDEFPDPPNCCGYSLGKAMTGDAGTDYLHATGDPNCFAATCMRDAMLCPKTRCGDGIDESCRGQGANDPANDTACFVDEDCDGYSPPEDCNDHDPTIHPGAKEICGDGINQSCSKYGPDAGCVACDLDGDGFERNDATAGCPDKNDQHSGQFDCNDYDAAVFPGASAAAGGKEGGINALGKTKSALLGLCRRVYGDKGTTGTPLVAVSGWTVGDFDCNGVAYEACPPATCDADGDGWPKDSSCNSATFTWAGPYDCNDNDPTIFPGAPDKCSDGIDSACAGSDTQCAAGTDADGDGYVDLSLGGSDCNDKDASVHPFQLDVCNGVDDNCNGEIDEGNPDVTGAPLVTGTAITSCTDNNLGVCGTQKGLCVCSHANPNSQINTTARTACPGDVTGASTPHCYGAGQPHKQTCDANNNIDDDCDGSTSALPNTPAAMNLLNFGQPCGLTMGPCKAGTMVGCDRSQMTNPWYGTQATPADQYWVCSPNTSKPTAEVCNGIDDDCNGQLPFNETDPDMDHWIACAPCVGTIASGLLGCGDCDETNPSVNPGGHDVCNGLDLAVGGDDCNFATADGSYDCTPMGLACCNATGGGNTCKNLATDAQNCSACGDVCNSVFVNACAGSTCVCGNTGAPCPGNSFCSGNGCSACNTNSHCGPSCIACGTGSVCKSDGTACTGCNTDSDCADPTNQYCKGGVCTTRTPKGGGCTAVSPPDSPNDSCALNAPYCTDGVCCDTSPSACGVCKTCALGGSQGTCVNTPNGQESGNECPGTAPCQGNKCNGNGSCNLPDGSTCSTPTCSTDSSSTLVDECTAGACNTTTPVATSCAPYACSGGACETSCTSNTDCKSPATPNCWPTSQGGNGNCYAKKVAGATCAVDSDCNSGMCVSTICCGTTSKPSSCNDPSCASGSQTTYTCTSGSHYTACTNMVQSCAGLACTSGGMCQSACHCTTSPCVDTTDCQSGYYCASDGSMMCNACNKAAFCGPTCAACTGNFGCVAGACKTSCSSDADCAPNYWCQSGTPNSCVAQIMSGQACDATQCAMSGCNECVKSNGTSAQCPSGTGKTCP